MEELETPTEETPLDVAEGSEESEATSNNTDAQAPDQENLELVQLQVQASLVVIEYLPKLYVVGLLLLGCVVFGFIYKLIDRKFFSHFV